MPSDPNTLVLNPLTGRYVKKFSSSWLRLVAQGTIPGDPVITAPIGPAITEPVQVRNDRAIANELAEVAVDNKDALKGLSRPEIDSLLSKALYERLILRPAAPKSAALSKVGIKAPRASGLTARPISISRSVAAPLTAAQRTKKAMMDAQAYGSDTDSDEEEGDVSVSSADIETSAQESESDSAYETAKSSFFKRAAAATSSKRA